MLFKWLLSTFVILALAYLLPGIAVEGFVAALVAALVLGLINSFIKPTIILFTLPINIFTLGLFTLVINAVIVLIASAIVSGFSVDNFWWALLFSILIGLINSWLYRSHSHHSHHESRYHRLG